MQNQLELIKDVLSMNLLTLYSLNNYVEQIEKSNLDENVKFHIKLCIEHAIDRNKRFLKDLEESLK
jgi:energy-converting hydrogenase A subunit M